MAQFGGRARVIPGDTELLWHAISHVVRHTQGSPLNIRLRGWLDAAALLAAASPIDWERIDARVHSEEIGLPRFAEAWLRAAGDLSGRPLPPQALTGRNRSAFNVQRFVAWRLRVLPAHDAMGRWHDKLIVEGVRGEAGLPLEPAAPGVAITVRWRHAIASCAARLWWILRR